MKRILLGGVASAMLVLSCGDSTNTPTSSSTASGSAGNGGAGGEGASAGSGGAAGNAGSSNSTSSGAGGSAASCVPGETATCYSGAFGTDGVGECKTGTKTCDSSGKTFGPCVGEVIPQTETCATPGDEDCDGSANEEGQDCVCIPGSVKLCYSGAPNTVGIGVCTEGVITCAPDGLGFGACAGEVVPGVENCATPADEDCDGQTPLCPAFWASRYGSTTGSEFIWGMALDSTGSSIVVGDMEGTVDFGGGPLTSAGSSDVFVAKFDAMGNHVWSKQFGNVALQSGQAIAVTPTDEVVVVGYFQGTVNFGGGVLTSAGGADMFVAKFDSAGTHLWSKRFGSATDDQLALAVAVDSVGDVYFTGSFYGTMSFGGTNLASAGGADVFVAKLAGATGNHLRSAKYGDAGIEQVGRSITVDGMDNVLVTGAFDGTINLGGNALTTAGLTDAFVAKFDSAGVHMYSASFGDAQIQLGRAIAADAAGNFIVAGDSNGTIDLGGGPLAKAGNFDMFTGLFDPTGTHMKSVSFGGPNNDSVTSIALENGALAMTGYLEGSAMFGGVSLVSAGGRDIIVAKLSAMDLSVTGARIFGDTSFYQSGQGVCLDAMGNTVVAGYMLGGVDFGLGPLTSAGFADAFIAHIPF